LGDRLAQFCRDFSDRYGMQIELECPEGVLQLPSPHERELLLMLGEALHNVRRHSGTHQASVGLCVQQRYVVLRVSDKGCGMAVQAGGEKADGAHFGLTSMTDRAVRLGGTLVVTSEPQLGTTVKITIPRP